MCGRFALFVDFETLKKEFGIVDADEAAFCRKFNISPDQKVLVVQGPGRLIQLKWGSVPFWSKDGKGFINARAETVCEKPSFRDSMKSRRCIIPASGFYEWKKTGKVKKPFWIHGGTASVWGFGGIWENGAFAIITTPANGYMSEIHDRMPLILEKKNYDSWLDDNRDSHEFLKPYLGRMEAYPVSIKVNSPVNDGPELLEQQSENL